MQFGRDYKNKRRLTIQPHEADQEAVEYLIPKGKHIHLQDGDVVEKGDFIVDGNPAPHDILAIKGVEELAAYLVNEIQEVYRLQGVQINDKHIEVIVRQMLQKIEIVDPGETEFLPGEQVDRIEFDEANAKAVEERQEAGRRAIRCCSASPRPRCRPGPSSRRPRSRRPPASSPRRRSTASRTRSRASRRTSSSAASSRRAPAPRWRALREIAKHRDDLILQQKQQETMVTPAPEAEAETVALPAAE